ncbi:MAG: serine hydrolase domain-containing protein [Pseudomonadota bacterium]
MKKVSIRHCGPIILASAISMVIAVSCTAVSPEKRSTDELATAVQSLVDSAIKAAPDTAPIHSAIVNVTSDDLQRDIAIVAGVTRPGTNNPATINSPFHIASITKPMTAVIILRMAERGAFGPAGIDTTLSSLGILSTDDINRLHRINGRSYGHEITLRHLLAHTHGMRDVLIDGPNALASDEPAAGSLVGTIFANLPDHMACLATDNCDTRNLPTGRNWTPFNPSGDDNGILNFYLSHDYGTNALFPPGTGFHYSDTGYVLLALVAERVAGAGFAEILQTEIFDPSGMANSWFFPTAEKRALPATTSVMEVYAGKLPLMTTGVSLSFDWGGGGVVATAGDLAAFADALISGRLLATEQSRDDIFSWTSQSRRGDPLENAYGLGVGYRHSGGFDLIGHSGAWGGFMSCEPVRKLCVTGTVNQAYANQGALVDAIFNLFAETEKPE